MKGIDSEALEIIHKKIISDSLELQKQFEKSNAIYQEMSNSYNGEGLKFLFTKLNGEISQFPQIEDKINQYAMIINKTVLSYKEEDELLSFKISQSTSMIGGRGK